MQFISIFPNPGDNRWSNEPALEAAVGELTVVEEAATVPVLAVDVLVEEAPRGVAPGRQFNRKMLS